MITRPPKILPGDTIGIIATSSHIVEDRLQAGINIIQNLGLKTKIHPNAYKISNQFAGTGEEKAQAYHDFVNDSEVKAIFSARGGNRSDTMLTYLDFELIKKNPKVFVGFSDTSTLSMALESQANMSSVFGYVVQTLIRAQENDIDFLFRMLQGDVLSYPMNEAKILKPGQCEGRVIGGTLAVFQALIGTDYAPNFSGRILVIEDLGEELSHIDRKLAHLQHCGIFDCVAGVVFGNFSDIRDTGNPFGLSLEEIFLERTRDVKGPIIMNAPFGHEGPFYALPMGGLVRLKAHDHIALDMLEAIVT